VEAELAAVAPLDVVVGVELVDVEDEVLEPTDETDISNFLCYFGIFGIKSANFSVLT
jgi:hypothetical protein